MLGEFFFMAITIETTGIKLLDIYSNLDQLPTSSNLNSKIIKNRLAIKRAMKDYFAKVEEYNDFVDDLRNDFVKREVDMSKYSDKQYEMQKDLELQKLLIESVQHKESQEALNELGKKEYKVELETFKFSDFNEMNYDRRVAEQISDLII